MSAPFPLKIPNPSFEKYAYHILSTLTPEKKNKLPEKDRALVNNEDELKEFCNKNGHVKIEILLLKVGIESVRIFYSEEDPGAVDQVIFNTANQYRYPQKRSDLIEAMAQHKIYATSSREIIATTLMMAQNANTKLYQLTQASKDTIKEHLRLKKYWSTQKDADDAAEAYAGFNRLILEQLNGYDYLHQTHHLSQEELRIMSALYAKPYHAIPLSELSEQTKIEGKVKYLQKITKNLEDRGFIVSDRTRENRRHHTVAYYLLSAKGIKTMVEYLQYIFKKTYT